MIETTPTIPTYKLASQSKRGEPTWSILSDYDIINVIKYARHSLPSYLHQ